MSKVKSGKCWKVIHNSNDTWTVELNVSTWWNPNINCEKDYNYLVELTNLITQSSKSDRGKKIELKRAFKEWIEQQIIEKRVSLTKKSNWRKINRDD